MKAITSILTAVLLLVSLISFSQERGRRGGVKPHIHKKVIVKPGHHKPNRAVVVHSPYRPAKVVVFHPYWGPKHAFNRRWVYFPRYNFYWDNWREVYFFWDGVTWVMYKKAPAVIVNVNLEKEKHFELKENEDDIDDVYRTNDSHKTDYKAE